MSWSTMLGKEIQNFNTQVGLLMDQPLMKKLQEKQWIQTIMEQKMSHLLYYHLLILMEEL
jgi:hypothetical protein